METTMGNQIEKWLLEMSFGPWIKPYLKPFLCHYENQ